MSKKKFALKTAKKAVTYFVVFSLVLWALALPLPIPKAQAMFGYDIRYVDDGGATDDIFLNDADTAELCLTIDAFESTGSGNVVNGVTLEIMDGMGPNNIPTGFDRTHLSEVALYLDADGSNSFDGTDTFLASSSPSTWTQVSNPTRWRYNFSSLAATTSIPTSYSMSNQNRILVTAKPASVSTSSVITFHFQVPSAGVDVTVASGATLTDFPVAGGPMGSTYFSPPINIGSEGAGGWGSPVVVSEIQTGGATTTDDFVELYNRSPQAVDLDGYSLLYYAANVANLDTPTQTLSITGGVTTTIPGNGFLLIANNYYDGSTTTDQTYYFDLGTSGIVMLIDTASSMIDKVGYGTLASSSLAEGGVAAPGPASTSSIERKARPGSSASSMASGGVEENQGNGEDTNYNAGDFIVRTTPDPQNSTCSTEGMSGDMGQTGTPFVLNEVLYNATSSGGWIEVYNRNTTNPTSSLAGWKLVSNGKTYTVPDNAATQAVLSGGRAVVYWNLSGTNSSTSGSTLVELYTETTNWTDMSTYGGDVVLKNAADVMKDYVQYGGSGMAQETAAVNAGQWTTGDYVPRVLYNQSMGRRSISGEDYNDSDDWQVYASPSPGYPNMGGDATAPTRVTNVVLKDNDTTANSGIDGRDVSIYWTPDPTPDNSFDQYIIYLLPNGTALNTESHSPIERIYGGQYQYTAGTASTTYRYTGSSFITQDSAASNLASGTSYVAYVLAQDMAGNRSSAAVSQPVQITQEAYLTASDSQSPYMMHMGVWQAKLGANIVLVARADDDRGLGANVPYAIWKTGANNTVPDLTSGTATSTCVVVESNYYTCTIVDPGWDADSIVGYYLKVKDENSNIRYLSASPSADDSGVLASVQANPFLIDILAANNDSLGDYQDDDANADLSGNVYGADGSVFANGQQPYLYIEGTAVGTVQASNTTGAFSFADNTLLPGPAHLVAFKAGYMDMMMDVFKGESSVSVYMNQGAMMFGMGGGEMPSVTWTGPGDGMMGVSRNIYCSSDCSGVLSSGDMPVVIGFSKEMNPNTINDQDAANALSNIYLTTTGNDRVAGKVKYVYNPPINEARFYAITQDSLQPGTFYSIVVTQGVTDTNGNPISGGSGAGGAFVNGFTTMADNSNIWGTGWQDYSGGEQGAGTGYMGMDYSSYGQGGMMMPPYVKGVVPSPGGFNVDRNRSVLIEFSESMNVSTINTTNIKLYPISATSTWAVGTVVPATVSLDSATQKIVTLDPTANLDLNDGLGDGWYVIRVMGAVKSASGVWMGDPGNCGAVNPDTCLASSVAYESSFQLNSTANGDTTNPTVLGTYPNNNDGITAGTVAVSVGLPSIDMAFSEPMTPSTITVQNITLKAGSSAAAGKVKYESSGNSAKFVPTSALLSNTQYVLTIGTGVTDLAGRALGSASVVNFKTGAADATAPEIIYGNADDYSMAITFSEPMNAAKQTDTSKWGASVLNPANYYLKGLATVNQQLTGVAPYVSGGNPVCLNTVSGLNFSYDEPSNTVMIDGFAFTSSEPHATDYQLFIDNVRDKSNNVIANSTERNVNGGNGTQGPVQSSASTYGMLGPGGGGMMMMGPMGGGGPMGPSAGASMAPSMDMGVMGMRKAGAMPMNMTAGQTSTYFVDVPLSSQIASGGKIVLTFPSGFNVSSAQQDPYSPPNQDFNEWGTGTITFACSASVSGTKNCGGGTIAVGDDAASSTIGGLADDGITVNTSARTVTVHTNGDTQANDFLHLDIKGIVNSSVPKEFGTDGYTVDIKTMTAGGVLLENITTMPFYLTQGGSITLSGVVNSFQGDGTTALNIDNGQTMRVFLGSPMTGPMETTITFLGTSTASYSFTNLSAGEYNVFTEPVVTLDVAGTATDFQGMIMPEPVRITANTTKNLSVGRFDTQAGTAITVSLVGDFRTGGTADNVDVFANSPTGFRVKTLSAVGNTSHTTTTLYLSNGKWMVGIGPAMPKGPMSGPPKMPDWMPPMSIDIDISGATVKETSSSTNDGTIVFDISSQVQYSILGRVVDDTGTALSDTEVYGFNPQGGFGGSNTKTDTSGNFTLKVGGTGLYKVGAHKPGLPPSSEVTIDVRATGSYIGDTIIAQNSDFLLKLKKPAYTISGKVLNASSKPIAYAPVWAYQTSASGNSNTMTDASGNYILYVDNGTWRVETDAPGVGWLQYEMPITINNASQSNINLKPATDATFVDISGTVTINNTAQQYMPIRAVEYNSSGAYLGREYGSMTDSNGAYTITVQGSSADKYYRVDTWTPTYGEVERTDKDDVANNPANVIATTTDRAGVDITIAAGDLKTVNVVFVNGGDYSGKSGFLNTDGVTFTGAIPKPTGFHKSERITDLSVTTTLQVTAGDYFFFVDIPGVGSYMPNDASRDDTLNCIVVGANGAKVVFELPVLASGMITLTGSVTDSSSNVLSDAWFWVGNPNTGYHNGCMSSATGTCAVSVPLLSSGNYFVSADKPNYMSPEPASNAGTASTTVSVSLTRQAYTISGYLYAESDSVAGYTTTSEAVANGWVHAEEITSKNKTFAPVDGAGYYSLGVTNGTWRVYGKADSYLESQYSVSGIAANLTVSSASLANKHILLSPDSNWTSKTKSSTVKPSSGGVIDDTGSSGTGVKLTLPPQALGNSTDNASLSVKETRAVSNTQSARPFAGKGKEITATDNSGQPITNLNDYVDVELTIYKTEVDSEVTAGTMVDKTKLKATQVGYWDDTANDWVNLPTTKTAYYKANATATEWTMYPDSGSTPGYEDFVDDALAASPTFTDYTDYKLVLKASTNHFTVYGATQPKDGVLPSAPTGLAQVSGSGTSVVLSWTAVATNYDTTVITDLLGYQIYRSTDDSTYTQVSTTTATAVYADDTTAAWTSYYYKVTTSDDGGNETGLASSTAVQMCSTKTVSSGTVANTCAITCDSGYTQSGYTCVAAGGGITLPVTPTPTPTPTAEPVVTTQPVVAPTETVAAEAVAVSGSGGGSAEATTELGTTVKLEIPANAVVVEAVVVDAVVDVTPVSTKPVEVVPGEPVPAVEPAMDVSVQVAAVPATQNIVGGYVYNYSVSAAGQAVTEFAEPVTLSFTYTDDQISGLNEDTLTIAYYNEATSQWVEVESTVDKVNKKVTATVSHFTLFALLGEEAPEEEPPAEAPPTPPISEMTIEQLKAEIARIAALIAELQAQLLALLGEGIAGVPATFSFETTLKEGMASPDVKYMQIVLNSNEETRLAVSGVGSPGQETNYFGSLTESAVIKFQEKYASTVLAPWNLSKGTGLVGSTTRAKLNQLLGR